MRHCRHGQVPGGSRVDRPLQLREQRGQHRLGATAQEFQREPKAPRLRQRSQHRHHKHGLAQRCAAALCAVLCRARVHQPTCLQRREDVLRVGPSSAQGQHQNFSWAVSRTAALELQAHSVLASSILPNPTPTL
eukprot:352348-Chlamydomonas_euryale.AAC.3